MNINMLLWWSLGRGNTVVPSRWQATLIRLPSATFQTLTISSSLAVAAKFPVGLKTTGSTPAS
jgi:hypothetical protein